MPCRDHLKDAAGHSLPRRRKDAMVTKPMVGDRGIGDELSSRLPASAPPATCTHRGDDSAENERREIVRPAGNIGREKRRNP